MQDAVILVARSQIGVPTPTTVTAAGREGGEGATSRAACVIHAAFVRGSRASRRIVGRLPQGCAADADALERHHQKLLEMITVAVEDIVEPGDPDRQGDVGTEPKQDHAAVWLPVVKHQLAKIGVVRDENAVLFVSDG